MSAPFASPTRASTVLTIYVRTTLLPGYRQDHKAGPATTGEAMAANVSRRELSGFDEPALWRANLGTAFSDLVPAPLDLEVAPQRTLRNLSAARRMVTRPLSGQRG